MTGSPRPPHVRAGLIVAAAVALLGAGPAPDPDLAAARAKIAAANRDWVIGMETGDARKVAAPYADDAVFVTPDGQSLAGRAAIERFTAERFGRIGRVTGGDIRQDGLRRVASDLIYEWGRGRLEFVDRQGRRRVSAGHYLTVWRRDGSGIWRIARNLAL
jgi:uncharacterized protein (TIGR02246 family)